VATAIKKKAAPPVREFKQKRAAATYEALLDAAEDVFATRGFDGAQSAEIAAAAGVSTGAFYRYFADKRQCFLEMIARELQRAHEDVLRRLDPAKFREGDERKMIEAALRVLFDHSRNNPALGRVYQALSLTDPDVARIRADYESRALDSLTIIIQQLVPRSSIADPRAAALVIQLAAVEIGAHQGDLRPRISTVTDAAALRALVDMLHRYLFPA